MIVRFRIAVLFLFVKYFVFFFILAFIGNRYKHLVLDRAVDMPDFLTRTLGYVLYVAFLSMILIAILSFPLYWLLRIRNGIWFLFASAGFFLGEYLLYTWSASQSDWTLGIYNGLVGLVLLLAFFGRSIKSKFGSI